jgi:high affinity Mn2+ porin
MQVRASATPYYDWTGYYVGSHLSYATGYSKWSATEAGAVTPSLAGSLNFFHAFDGFKGTGSYLLGLQAGYSYMFPSRLLLGIEADVSFPSLFGGSQVISSDLIGQADYQELVQFSGTVRGRVGFAPGHWLFYATGGFAWTYNQFTRTQLAGSRLAARPIRATMSRCS